jgi:hypothetical protein
VTLDLGFSMSPALADAEGRVDDVGRRIEAVVTALEHSLSDQRRRALKIKLARLEAELAAAEKARESLRTS